MRAPQPPDIDHAAPDEAAVEVWADALEAVLHTLCKGLAEGQWALFTAGDTDLLEALDPARIAVYGDDAVLDALCRWKAAVDAGFRPSNGPLARRMMMLHREFLREAVGSEPEIAAVSTDLAGRMSRFRATLAGVEAPDTAIADILSRHPDRARREQAWRARCGGAADFAGDIVALRDLRNAQAQRHGYADFYALGLAVRGLAPAEVAAIVESLLAGTQAAWERYTAAIAARVGADDLMPWDLGLTGGEVDDSARFPAAEAEARALRTFEALGLPLDHVSLDLGARDSKSEHAWCVPVDPPADIRVTATLADGAAGYNTLLHELGHAAHSSYVAGEHFVLRDTPNDALHEGLAQLFAYLVYNPDWLSWAAGASPDEAQARVALGRSKKLLSMRWWIVWIRFEQALFCAPDRDPTEAFWEICDTVLGIRAGPELRTVPAWARVVHLATHPVYIQNYLLADIAAAQLDQALEARFGRWFCDPASGALLREAVIAPGATLDADELLTRATGRGLDAQPYAIVLSAV